MKQATLAVMVAVAVLAQMSWLPFVRPFGVVPSVVLAVVVLVAVLQTARFALVVAAAAGLALDMASAANFGLWTALLILVVLAGGFVRQAGIELNDRIVGGVMAVACTVLFSVVTWLGLAPVVGRWPVGWMLGQLGAQLVLNLALMLLLRPLVYRLRSENLEGPYGSA